MRKLYIICCVAAFLACGRSPEEDKYVSIIDSLKVENKDLQQANDTLSEHLLKKAYIARNYPKYFDTIPEPEEFILKEISQEPGLIPKEAVLGGTMRFTEVSFINDKLITASYEEGHVMGEAVYSYSMNKRGQLQFSLVGIVKE
ncbi:hypothetical protein FHG64_15710 [Antarcticibacterium flavum]|uniref:Uncharacterized protein n=1 Tax=Antarcticibacterium flavum TaxID=2058175 RepID=A0A5B7X7V9_9FLAO|nr:MULTISPECIES: hypothetical protein [Antarcticibacterium]MCM4159793.1 hypothetical protein [Antarcticibacterium sp. W02-3]QCY70721.1 hypothetical protein FHG64_15710 [Antarcticibacterium flavum]